MLAGSVGLQSPPQGRDEGSTFWLDIPVTLTKEDSEEQDKESESPDEEQDIDK